MELEHDFVWSADPEMLAEFGNLFRNLKRAAGSPPDDLLKAVKRLPVSTPLPSPVHTWSLLNFVAKDDRRNWAGTTLLPFLAQDWAIGRLLLESRERLDGRVPGHPDWRFILYDRGTEFYCLVCHLASGERIDLSTPVAFCDTGKMPFGGVSDGYRRAWLLSRLDFGSDWNCMEDLERRALGHWLAEQLPMHRSAIRTFHQRWKDESQRIWLAALLGDWLNAHAAALLHGDGPLIAEIERRTTKWMARFTRQRFVFRPLNAECDWRWAAGVLSRHQVSYLDEIIYPELLHEENGRPWQLNLILEEDLPGWEEDLLAWFLSPRDWEDADREARTAAYLARRGISKSEVIKTLVWHTCGNPQTWDLLSALVVARYERGRAEVLFRQGLRCPNETKCIQALAALAVSDWPWAEGLLQDALGELTSSETIQAMCRFALEWRKGNESPTPRCHTTKEDRTLLVVNCGPGKVPLRYLGTLEQLFEENVQEVRRCQAIADRDSQTPPTVSEDLGEEAT